MAALPPVRRIGREDLGPDVPQWVARLLSPLNLALEALYRALNHNITFTENIRAGFKEFQIVGGANRIDNTYSFLNPLGAFKPTGVLILGIFAIDGTPISTDATHISWSWNSSGNTIDISSITGLAVGVGYTIRLLII